MNQLFSARYLVNRSVRDTAPRLRGQSSMKEGWITTVTTHVLNSCVLISDKISHRTPAKPGAAPIQNFPKIGFRYPHNRHRPASENRIGPTAILPQDIRMSISDLKKNNEYIRQFAYMPAVTCVVVILLLFHSLPTTLPTKFKHTHANVQAERSSASKIVRSPGARMTSCSREVCQI